MLRSPLAVWRRWQRWVKWPPFVRLCILQLINSICPRYSCLPISFATVVSWQRWSRSYFPLTESDQESTSCSHYEHQFWQGFHGYVIFSRAILKLFSSISDLTFFFFLFSVHCLFLLFVCLLLALSSLYLRLFFFLPSCLLHSQSWSSFPSALPFHSPQVYHTATHERTRSRWIRKSLLFHFQQIQQIKQETKFWWFWFRSSSSYQEEEFLQVDQIFHFVFLCFSRFSSFALPMSTCWIPFYFPLVDLGSRRSGNESNAWISPTCKTYDIPCQNAAINAFQLNV